MKSLALNLLIAVIWLLLSAEPSVTVFTLGALIGFALLAAFHRVLGSREYVRRTFALVRFAVAFTGEFLAANANVVRTVLFRSPDSLHPNFVTYNLDGMTRTEILIVSYCISLTPGSTTVSITDDFKTLILHTLDVDDPQAVRARLDRVLKHPILSFTR